MNDLYMLANSNKEMQIKGHKQLTDLTSLMEFLTSKFDVLEKERKEKDELTVFKLKFLPLRSKQKI